MNDRGGWTAQPLGTCGQVKCSLGARVLEGNGQALSHHLTQPLAGAVWGILWPQLPFPQQAARVLAELLKECWLLPSGAKLKVWPAKYFRGFLRATSLCQHLQVAIVPISLSAPLGGGPMSRLLSLVSWRAPLFPPDPRGSTLRQEEPQAGPLEFSWEPPSDGAQQWLDRRQAQ